jgi:predicted O-linked N-acetylglucosamine transferase (SPINDLY family)
MDSEATRNQVYDRCQKQGIPMDRVIFTNRAENRQYSLYHKIDIALDPFPCNGGTTTCDALWMSIPVVSLQGNRFMSRMGATLLTNIGHPEWLANSEDEYIDIAVNLASDVEKLNQIRKSLRGEVEESPIMNDIELGQAQRDLLRDRLSKYCAETFDLELEQFDAEFFVDFIAKELGPLFYNAGIEEAIRTHQAWSERIQEEMDLKKVY